MRLLAMAVILAIVLVAPAPAGAQQMTDNGVEFLRACEGRTGGNEAVQQLAQMACLVYLGGWVDAYRVFSAIQPSLRVVCLPPEGLSNEQYGMVFIRWLRAHPEQLHHTPRILFLAALKEAFPCRQ
jgi:hypothetical protein